MSYDYEFDVEREALKRSDGVDTGYDSIYRLDSGAQLGVVSRRYKLVPHADAMNFVYDILDRMDLPHAEPRVKLSNFGSKMYTSIPFPELRFNPTATEGFGHDEDFDPVMRIHNSYDGSKAFSFLYGVEKLICINGAVVFRAAQSIKLKHYSKNIEFDKIRPMIEKSLKMTIVKTKGQVKKLESEDGFPYLQLLMAEQILAKTYKEAILELLGEPLVTVMRDDSGRILEVSEGMNPFNAYLLWCAVTNVSTHNIESPQVQSDVDLMIAKTFF